MRVALLLGIGMVAANADNTGFLGLMWARAPEFARSARSYVLSTYQEARRKVSSLANKVRSYTPWPGKGDEADLPAATSEKDEEKLKEEMQRQEEFFREFMKMLEEANMNLENARGQADEKNGEKGGEGKENDNEEGDAEGHSESKAIDERENL